MLKMNYWTDKWDLHVDVCPCDVHFNEWVKARKLKGKTIYHFGTGTHHVVGIRQAELGNCTLAITASKEEYDAYYEACLKLVRPSITASEKAISSISATFISAMRGSCPSSTW